MEQSIYQKNLENEYYIIHFYKFKVRDLELFQSIFEDFKND